jgi:hypothetical protein
MLDVFIYHSSLYFLRQGLSLNLELTNSKAKGNRRDEGLPGHSSCIFVYHNGHCSTDVIGLAVQQALGILLSSLLTAFIHGCWGI